MLTVDADFVTDNMMQIPFWNVRQFSLSPVNRAHCEDLVDDVQGHSSEAFYAAAAVFCLNWLAAANAT
jgi:hypothetical protein